MSRIVLLLIRPEYARAIYDDLKCYEFRRVRAKLQSGDRSLEAAPISRVTGGFAVGRVITAKSDDVAPLMADPEEQASVQQYLIGSRASTAIKVLAPAPVRWNHSRMLATLLPQVPPTPILPFPEGRT